MEDLIMISAIIGLSLLLILVVVNIIVHIKL